MLTELPKVNVPEALLELDRPEVIEALRNRPLEIGQLWMARTNVDDHQYVLLLGGERDGRIRVMPVEGNASVNSEDAFIVTDTPLYRPVSVWPREATTIPMSLLFRPCGDFTPSTTRLLAVGVPCAPAGILQAMPDPDPMPSVPCDVAMMRRRMREWHHRNP
ncbi:hypothetical protein [Bifidobacterium felsineum]|uniref:hypothetical protein n=1 Tax=Bifidobacterium felsineum TaxID=2045440 RepID=UPI001BDC05E0|nr:hypothetical protein [Bifidobacterium felsineum]MBT1164634.1 hypothetical protein [Bifidobacterium felsineum]